MSGEISYIISFHGRIIGQLPGQVLAITANCMNVPIPEGTLHYIKLGFTGVTSVRALQWVWGALHHGHIPTPVLDESESLEALFILQQLGAPLDSLLGWRWFTMFFGVITVDANTSQFSTLRRLRTLFPCHWFQAAFTRTYDAALPDTHPVWRYHEILTAEDINIELLYISSSTDIVAYIDGRIVTKGFIDVRRGKWIIGVYVDRQPRPPSASYSYILGGWIAQSGLTPINAHIYDKRIASTFVPPIDPRVDIRQRALQAIITRGAAYLTPITLGKMPRVLHAGIWMMSHVSNYFRSLTEISDVIPVVVPSYILTPEIERTWLALNGSLLVMPDDPFKAWHYASYFLLDVSSPYVVNALRMMLNIAHHDHSRASEVAKILLSIPSSKREEMEIFDAPLSS